MLGGLEARKPGGREAIKNIESGKVRRWEDRKYKGIRFYSILSP
jgi:hypothetical protein